MKNTTQHLDLSKTPNTQNILKRLLALSPSEQEKAVKAINELMENLGGVKHG